MPIPAQLIGCFFYHFTSIENFRSILEHGFLSPKEKERKGINHLDVANNEIQERRRAMIVSCNSPTTIHDYVPFYFAKRTSMLASIINDRKIDQKNIIYFALPIELSEHTGIAFTDSSANKIEPPNFFNSSNDLEKLSWDIINKDKWKVDCEEQRNIRMAEFLYPTSLAFSHVAKMIVWDNEIKNKLEDIAASLDTHLPYISTYDHKQHYFVANWKNENEAPVSIVTGPDALFKLVSEIIYKINDMTNRLSPKKSICKLVSEIRSDFCCLKELADIDGMQTSNNIHHEDVGAHSRSVAKNIVNSELYAKLSNDNKALLELAAYLHDIGKGPKSRWVNEVQDVDNEHCCKSLPMLERIIVEELGSIPVDTLRKLITFVVYDDIIGEIVAKGRKESEFFRVVIDKEDVDMIIELGKADMAAINPAWIDMHSQAIENVRQRAYIAIE